MVNYIHPRDMTSYILAMIYIYYCPLNIFDALNINMFSGQQYLKKVYCLFASSCLCVLNIVFLVKQTSRPCA